MSDAALLTKPIVCFDVGARGSLQPHWHDIALQNDPDFLFYLFEPDPQAADALRQIYMKFDRVKVIQQALFHQAGEFELNITAHSTCSSLLVPNSDFLSSYNIAPIFDIVKTIKVACSRLDNIVVKLGIPPPDFVKIDVQGVELQVLAGMGGLLQNCLFIELEAHLYPIYKNQSLLHEIIRYLSLYGITLRNLHPQFNFDTDYVEVNAQFGKVFEKSGVANETLKKTQRIMSVLGLENHPNGVAIRGGMGLPPL